MEKLLRENDRLQKACIRHGIINEVSAGNDASSSSSTRLRRHDERLSYSDIRMNDQRLRGSSTNQTKQKKDLIISGLANITPNTNPYFLSTDDEDEEESAQAQSNITNKQSVQFAMTNNADNVLRNSENNLHQNLTRVPVTNNRSIGWGKLGISLELQNEQQTTNVTCSSQNSHKQQSPPDTFILDETLVKAQQRHSEEDLDVVRSEIVAESTDRVIQYTNELESYLQRI